MKVCEKKTKSGISYFIVINKELLNMVGIKKGDNVIAIPNEEKKEIYIKKINKEIKNDI